MIKWLLDPSLSLYFSLVIGAFILYRNIDQGSIIVEDDEISLPPLFASSFFISLLCFQESYFGVIDIIAGPLDLDKNSFESKYRSLGYARKGGAMFVQWLLLF